ncbi:MAG TPA: efflux RND transporter periplasmic adaptor subunit [Terriglobales bacterium]|nr:efflux RND transporter periplasmic adaptor subunit [Terriglobales bacterium]
MTGTQTKVAVAALAMAALGWTGCGAGGGANGGAGGNASAQAAAPEVTAVTPVVARKLNTTVELPAQLAAYEVVNVYPKVTGYVRTIAVDRGTRVRQGELLAQLEAPELLAQRAEAESKVGSAESQLVAARARAVADTSTYRRMAQAARTPGVVAANDLETARQAAQADQATEAAQQKTVAAAQAALRAESELEGYLRITAPFAGEVTTRYVHPGALVGPQGGGGAASPIVQIETRTRLRLVVPVPEYDAGDIPQGAMVAFATPAYPGRTFRAPVERIAHEVDVKTRTMPVELDVRDPQAELAPGMYCQVQWPVRRSYATLFVPTTAVASDLERTFVIRVRGGKAEWVDVTRGMAVGGETEVFGALQAGDVVVTHANDGILDGAAVRAHAALSTPRR